MRGRTVANDPTRHRHAVPANLGSTRRSIKVSVLFSPRLSGDDRLGRYADWLHWTRGAGSTTA